MDVEHKNEIIREEAQEIREEPMYIWIAENKDDLIKEFLVDFEDDLDMFCREQYQEMIDPKC